ncbi:hypothetical protein NEOLEDRAFT_1141540 [Neolentinus lepideus HHB14362 ss-1]|uniref:Uncharacterized protein n=1 Tax=Neolentinus lepideus HHB14362 ss-1 TaxID=1314782 RepID=A0A165NKW2_9AGAM|nr:hypothetical protein NEOLEDRAFT_1141540 [Neolentinus lepideus HHB14362 ss-1]
MYVFTRVAVSIISRHISIVSSRLTNVCHQRTQRIFITADVPRFACVQLISGVIDRAPFGAGHIRIEKLQPINDLVNEMIQVLRLFDSRLVDSLLLNAALVHSNPPPYPSPPLVFSPLSASQSPSPSPLPPSAPQPITILLPRTIPPLLRLDKPLMTGQMQGNSQLAVFGGSSSGGGVWHCVHEVNGFSLRWGVQGGCWREGVERLSPVLDDVGFLFTALAFSSHLSVFILLVTSEHFILHGVGVFWAEWVRIGVL